MINWKDADQNFNIGPIASHQRVEMYGCYTFQSSYEFLLDLNMSSREKITTLLIGLETFLK